MFLIKIRNSVLFEVVLRLPTLPVLIPGDVCKLFTKFFKNLFLKNSTFSTSRIVAYNLLVLIPKDLLKFNI